MKNLTAELVADLAKTADQAIRRGYKSEAETADLDRRYQQIGISAVAAAVRYQGAAKNPAYAPAPAPARQFAGEAA